MIEEIQSRESVGKEITAFLARLAHESERAAVVMGIALTDECLESTLVKLLRSAKSKNDNLFDPDRPIGSFGAKIKLAYRLGLIDDEFCSALNMLRKIRNDFAHSSFHKSLSDQEHSNRIDRLKIYTAKTPLWDTLVAAASVFISTEHLVNFAAIVGVIVALMRYLESTLDPIKLANQASFSWYIVGTDGIGKT
jgi:DNA-binding MltR family transcriptional regulator